MPSPFRFLRAGPPPPKVALLPDALFFTRVVPVAEGATPAEATSQVELALEAISPFPLAQLYYGWFWAPGSGQALVFAAYRRRFTGDQTTEWGDAELVLPSFASVVGANVKPATTILLQSADALTAVYWETTPIPAKVVSVPFAPEATDEERAAARDALLRDMGGSRTVIDLVAPLAVVPTGTDGEVVFRSDDFVSRIPAATATALDVRDKAELAALRNARRRDVILWRVALGAAAGLLLLLTGELALLGAGQWQAVREREYNAQKPLVDKIASLHELSTRIDELATKRLLPIEMIEIVVGGDPPRKPEEVQFITVQADTSRGLYVLHIRGRATSVAQYNAWVATLENMNDQIDDVENTMQTRGDQATFTIDVTFKPDALKPTSNSQSPTG